jgi:hypothetical protein
MKHFVRILMLAGIPTLLACSTSPVRTTDRWGNPAYGVATEDPAVQQRHDAVSRQIGLASALSLLSGRFQGTSPGNDLTLDLQRVRDPRTASVSLRVRLSGVYRGEDVRRSDLLRLQARAASPDASYFLDFDPAVDRVSAVPGGAPGRSACWSTLVSNGEGFTADVSCRPELATRRWAIEIQPRRIVLRSRESNETLEFSKVDALGRTASR